MPSPISAVRLSSHGEDARCGFFGHRRLQWIEGESMADIRAYLEQIVNTMNDGLMVVAPDGPSFWSTKRCAASPATDAKNFSASPAPCSTVTAAKGSGARAAPCGALFSTRGSLHHKRCVVVRKDGGYVHVLKNASVLKDESGRVIGAVETLTDISELDRKEEQIVRLSRLLDSEKGFRGIIGTSPVMQKVFDLTEKAAKAMPR